MSPSSPTSLGSMFKEVYGDAIKEFFKNDARRVGKFLKEKGLSRNEIRRIRKFFNTTNAPWVGTLDQQYIQYLRQQNVVSKVL